MISRILLLGVLATFAANVAEATVYFDSLHVTGANAGADGYNDGTTVMAESFTTATPDFSALTLALRAATPGDSGSFDVYLVPDVGPGGSMGVAENPTYVPGGTVFSSFTKAQLVATVADAALTTAPAPLKLWIGTSTITPVTAATFNDEYWIGVVPLGSSSVEWEFNSGSSGGLGSTNQNFFSNYDGTAGSELVSAVNGGAYEMIVATPEPMTIAILGAGLAGLGYIRRRGVKQS